MADTQTFRCVSVETTPISGQKPGTSGLRKKVSEFSRPHYTENFVQAILTAVNVSSDPHCTLVVGGDGRFFMDEALVKIVRLAAANGVSRIITGQNGILSTPAVSCIIRKRKVFGGIILTASHNPGGVTGDFGIKYNSSNGGPATESVTNAIYEVTQKLLAYRTCPDLPVDVSHLGCREFALESGRRFQLEVISSTEDYLTLMKEIFDFNLLRSFAKTGLNNAPFSILVDCMHGVTGPYANSIFCDELGYPKGSVLNAKPLPDFGGSHPDPNLVHAASLVKQMESGLYDMGAAFDGDGDRNMILGRNGFFVTPSDSLATIAENASCIPYFQTNGLAGVARSMPTSVAVDAVSAEREISFYEVPTGWKYFGNLMDAGKISLCGEESFGTGSNHIREKDGIWAMLSWMSIVASLSLSVESVVNKLWCVYGRYFYLRYDYEELDAELAMKVMNGLSDLALAGPPFKIPPSFSQGRECVSVECYSYTDPVDGSVTSNQGFICKFSDWSRFVLRISGTGSSGATLRLYLEQPESNQARFKMDSRIACQGLADLALALTRIPEITGRSEPTVIT